MMYNAGPRQRGYGQSQFCCSPKAILITAIVLLTIGGIVAWVGVFTPYMSSLEYTIPVFLITVNVHAGVFTECATVDAGADSVSCGSLLTADHDVDWLKACQSKGILASIGAFVSWVMLLCWLCQTAKTQCLKWTIIVIMMLSVALYAVALVLWAVKYDEVWIGHDLAWGYYIAWVGVALMLIAGILLIFHPTGSPYPQQQMMAYGAPMAQPMTQPMAQPGYVQPQPYYQPQPQPMQQLKPAQLYPQSQLSSAYSHPSAYSGYNTGYTGYR